MMRDERGLVSIILPAYNAQLYIEEAMRSVLEQSYRYWELIVINDGSSDDTATIIRRFVDERITIIDQSNQGVSVARNVGIERARGEYITFLDADDVLPLDSIEMRVEYLEKNITIDVVHGMMSMRDETMKKEKEVRKPFYYNNLLKRILYLDNRLSFTPCYMIRRDKLSVKFQERMSHAEDIIFLIQLSLSDLTLGYLDKRIYYYRLHLASVSHNLEGLKEGYLLLIDYLNDSSIAYHHTIVMRLKLFKLFLKWYIKERPLVSIRDLVAIF
jgi:teichuronic acid biosynthesis glycosyltransferase TuaG